MDEEIKFRVWDTHRNEMLYDVVPFAGDIWVLNYEEDALVPLYSDDQIYYNNIDLSEFPIMQYTGYKDVNGKEIYVDDIVDIYIYDPDTDAKQPYLIGVRISFSEGAFGIYNTAIGQFMSLGYLIKAKKIIEVVSNIHERDYAIDKACTDLYLRIEFKGRDPITGLTQFLTVWEDKSTGKILQRTEGIADVRVFNDWEEWYKDITKNADIISHYSLSKILVKYFLDKDDMCSMFRVHVRGNIDQ